MTPGQQAVVDQGLAAFGGEIDMLVATVQRLKERRAHDQAVCDLTALLQSGHCGGVMELSALLAIAVGRLSTVELAPFGGAS